MGNFVFVFSPLSSPGFVTAGIAIIIGTLPSWGCRINCLTVAISSVVSVTKDTVSQHVIGRFHGYTKSALVKLLPVIANVASNGVVLIKDRSDTETVVGTKL